MIFPSNKLTVIIRDDSPMVNCGDSPAYRSVQIELTEEQVKRLGLLQTWTQGAITPRTDAQETTGDRMQYAGVVSVSFARLLEMELEISNFQAELWKKVAMHLAVNGDPKPWRSSQWKEAYEKCAAENKIL